MSNDIYQKGQVLLIVVLIMVVGLTVGLSLASRSITNLRITTEEENSQRAFSAAEAGIEQALRTNTPFGNQSLSNNATIESVDIGVSGSADEYLFNGGSVVFQDDGADLWLSDYNQDPALIYGNPWPSESDLITGHLQFFWGTTEETCSSGNASALEIIILSGPKTSPAANRYVFDPCLGRRISNNFKGDSGVGSVLGKFFKFSSDPIDVKVGRIAKVIPIYGNTQAGVKIVPPRLGVPDLPAQGKNISSTGKSGEETEKIVRKINVFQGYPSLPTELFAYILFVTQPN